MKTAIQPNKVLWKIAFKIPGFKMEFFGSFLLLFFVALFFSRYFEFIESRDGRVLADPILDFLPAFALSPYVFFILYIAIIITLYSIRNAPIKVLQLIQGYFLLQVFRVITIYLFPLSPHPAIIPLRDPLIEFFFYPSIVTKDLFFSGHVSSLCLFLFIVPSQFLKSVLFTFIFALAILLLVQHVHYSIDILAAPIFAWMSFYFAEKRSKIYWKMELQKGKI